MVCIENKDKGLQDKEEKLDHSLQVNADILTNGAEHKKDLGVHKNYSWNYSHRRKRISY